MMVSPFGFSISVQQHIRKVNRDCPKGRLDFADPPRI